jgi:hypothetical protein
VYPQQPADPTQYQPPPAVGYPATASFPTYSPPGQEPYPPVSAEAYPPISDSGYPVIDSGYPGQPGAAYAPGQPGYPAAPPGPGYPPGPGMGPYPPGPGFNPVQPGIAPPPRRSNVPIVAVIVAVALLLCGGTAVAGVLVVRSITDRAKDVVSNLPKPPDEFPQVPDLPTDLPNLPGLPTDGTYDSGKTVTVVYEVTGDGPVDITYVAKPNASPTQVTNAKLPWRVEVSMTGVRYVAVIALRHGTDSGTVGCRTTVDGQEVAKREGTGSFALTNCSKFIL